MCSRLPENHIVTREIAHLCEPRRHQYILYSLLFYSGIPVPVILGLSKRSCETGLGKACAYVYLPLSLGCYGEIPHDKMRRLVNHSLMFKLIRLVPSIML